MTETSEKAAPSDGYRVQLLDAMLALTPETGWTQATLDAAALQAGLSPGQAMLACPNGISDLLEALGERATTAIRARLAAPDVQAMKVRDKVRVGVHAYLAALDPAKPAVKRAAGSPASLFAGPKGAWAAADAIWAGLGDKSTDYNWYTKRLILSGVLASTFLVWLGTDDAREIDAFLVRRIENVMDFEKAKSRAKDFAARLPNPLDLLGRR